MKHATTPLRRIIEPHVCEPDPFSDDEFAFESFAAEEDDEIQAKEKTE